MKRILLFPFAVALMLGGAGAAFAGFTIDGEHDALVVEARDAVRSEIVSGIVERFGIETSGEPIQAGTVTGNFSGSLRQVLEAIAPGNGYAIAYADGRPSRITFTVDETASVQDLENVGAGTAAPVAPPAVASTGGENDAPSVERILQREVRSGTAPKQAETGDPKPQAEPNADLAEMTRRATAELEELVKSIRKAQP